MYFPFNLTWYSIKLDIARKKQEGWRGPWQIQNYFSNIKQMFRWKPPFPSSKHQVKFWKLNPYWLLGFQAIFRSWLYSYTCKFLSCTQALHSLKQNEIVSTEWFCVKNEKCKVWKDNMLQLNGQILKEVNG